MPELDPTFFKQVRSTRHEFLELIKEWRPELHRFCRGLTGNVWDAEDLLQDTLLKAYAKLGDVHWDVDRPRAYLFRMATNLWIDRVRALKTPPPATEPAVHTPPLPLEVREAIRDLAATLPPVERAAVLLKDIFDFSLEETAGYMRSTVGAVKAALHRGREKLSARAKLPTPAAPANGPEPKLLDAWCEAFNRRDMDALLGLMREDAEAEVVGRVHEYGRDQIKKGSLGHTVVEEGAPSAERVLYQGEPLVVLWYTVEEDGAPKRYVRDVLRFAQDGESLASLRYFYFCPETLAEICQELGLPLKDNGYWFK